MGNKKWPYLWAAFVFLSGCASSNVQQELAQLCESPTPFRFPLDQKDPADLKVSERFSAVCHRLSRIDGFAFETAGRAYICDATVYRDQANPRLADQVSKQEKAFGQQLRVENFDRSASEPDDLRERANRSRAPRELRRLPLGGSSGFAGVFGKFLILTDDNGNLSRVLYTYDDFDHSVRSVSSLSGAMVLLELKNQAGFGGAKNEQCRISQITSDDQGWTVNELPVQRNCAKSVARDVRIDRDGHVQRLKQYEPFKLFSSEPFICAD